MVLVSVVICTYNRSGLLSKALHTVCPQTLNCPEYEVIVIDNNSTDETSTVCQSFAEKYPNISIYFEAQQGLSYARNRGWREAKGEYIAYLDDDSTVPEEWLDTARTIIETVSPDVFSGPYLACYDILKPTWYKDEYGSRYLTDAAMTIDPQELHGCNLFLRRYLLELTGGFDSKLGMNGEAVAYGEETALMLSLYSMRPATTFYYDPNLFVYHLVRSEKMTLYWQFRDHFIRGRYADRVLKHHGQKQWTILALLFFMFKTMLKLVFSMTIMTVFRNRSEYPFFQNYWCESSWQNLYSIGLYYEQLQSSLR